MRRKLILAGVAILAAVGIVLAFRSPTPPSVLLVTLDTTRADRLGCYGHAAALTPHLDALAQSGVLFERAMTVAPCTLPAHASLFTGRYPAETGVRTNGRGRLRTGSATLAKELSGRGYDTGAFVGALVLDAKFGLDQGFGVYDDDFTSDDPDLMHRQRPGASVVDAALAWLGQERSRPFFCWVHLFDPHHPYLDHREEFGDRFSSQPYDAEIAYVDRQLGRLWEWLKGQGRDQDTLIVVVGDHGEGLGAHRERMHGLTLYDDVLRVPFIIHSPERLPEARRVSSPVSLVDLPRSVLDILGVGDSGALGGCSLLPLARGETVAVSPAYAATDEPFLTNGWSPLRSLTVGTWKYIRTTAPELYDLAADPQETSNLLERHADRAQELERLLAELEGSLVEGTETQVRLTEAEKQALGSLGYASVTAAPPRAAGPVLPDVKDMLPLDAAVEDAIDLIRFEKFDEAIQVLTGVVDRAPEFTRPYWYLAVAWRGQSNTAEATAILRRLIEVDPNSRQGHFGLGSIFAEQGRPEEAIAAFEKVLEVDPDYAEAHYRLARLFVQVGRPEPALEHLEGVLDLDPRHVAAYHWRGNLLAAHGRFTEAIADFRAAVDCAPGAADLHHNLGVLLADHGDPSEARRHLQEAVRLSPHSPEAHYSLGTALLRAGDQAAAAQMLSRAVELKPDFAAAEQALEAARSGARRTPAN